MADSYCRSNTEYIAHVIMHKTVYICLCFLYVHIPATSCAIFPISGDSKCAILRGSSLLNTYIITTQTCIVRTYYSL
jgi:hypothetical protein